VPDNIERIPISPVRSHLRNSVLDRQLTAAYFVLTAFTVLVGLFSRSLLPLNYSFDGNLIQAIAQDRAYIVPDSSFQIAGLFYKYLGLGNAPILVGILGTVSMSLFFWTLNRDELLSGTLATWGFAIISLALSAVYLAWYSKDLITLIMLATFASLARRRASLSLIPLLVYGLFFRTYWLLIIGIYLAAQVFTKRAARGISWLLGITFLVIAGMALTYQAVTGNSLDDVRLNLNTVRLGSGDANSMIMPFIANSSWWGGIINLELSFFSLVFPIPLITSGAALYLFSGLAIAWVWGLSLKSFPRTNGPDAFPSKSKFFLLAWAALIVFSVFEPDYGSYLRHLTPLLPLLAAGVSTTRTGSSPNR